MTKYRGADGWVHDDDVTSREEAPEKLDKCPNCGLTVSWRREEGYCTHCGWGKERPKQSGESSTAAATGCLFLVGAIVVCPLVGMGMGYGVGGIAGLLVGLGLGIAAPIALLIAVAASAGEKDA